MFKTIIAATDMVSEVDAPVLAAIELCGKYHSDLNILHILESASIQNRQIVRHFKTDKDLLVNPSYVHDVETRIEQTYKRFLSGLKKVQIMVQAGYPWEEILRVSQYGDTDLIVMGPHSMRAKEKGIARFSQEIGSTVQEVIAREDCPVMIVNSKGLKKQLEFKNIIVGIDFSVPSECALCFSARVARNFASRIYPFFMIPIPPYPKFTKAQYESNRKTQMEKLKNFCEFYLDGIGHEYVVQSGVFPHQEIGKYARKIHADLVMLGSHTKIKAGKWYAGSVVEQASVKACCPVIVVNDLEALHPWEDLKLLKQDAPFAECRNIHLFDEPQKLTNGDVRT